MIKARSAARQMAVEALARAHSLPVSRSKFPRAGPSWNAAAGLPLAAVARPTIVRLEVPPAGSGRTPDSPCACAVTLTGAGANMVLRTTVLLTANDAGDPHVRLCVQRRLACSAGERPAGARVEAP